MLISNFISDFGIVSMLNHTIDFNLVTKFMVWFKLEAIPKFYIKSVIKSDIIFYTSIKPTTWIGHKVQTPQLILKYYNAFLTDVGTNKHAF